MDNLQGGYLIVSLKDDNIFAEITEIVSRETKPLLIKGIEDYNTKDCFISVTDIIATKDDNDEVLYYTLPVSGLYKNESYCVKMAYVYPTVYTVKENRIGTDTTVVNIDDGNTIAEIKEAIDNKETEIIVKGNDIKDTKVTVNDITVTEDKSGNITEVQIPYNTTIVDNKIINNYITVTKTETSINTVNTYVTTASNNELGLVKGFMGSRNENGFITTDYESLTRLDNYYKDKFLNATVNFTSVLTKGYVTRRDSYSGINNFCETTLISSFTVPEGEPYTRFFISKDKSTGGSRFGFVNKPNIYLINSNYEPLIDKRQWQQLQMYINYSDLGYSINIPVLVQGYTQYPVGNDYTKQYIEMRLSFDDPYIRNDVKKASIPEGTYTIQNLIDGGFSDGSVLKTPNVHVARYKLTFYQGITSVNYVSETGLTLGDNYELTICDVSNVAGDPFMILKKIITI